MSISLASVLICNSYFPSLQVRTVHTHKSEKNFACEHCGKDFKYRSELTVHLTHHTGELNFSCSGCAKKFRRAAEARLCEKGHNGVFNFTCSNCDYKTHKRHHLDRHLKSHLKATPFSCPLCGFKSGRKDNLKQHVEKRHCTATTSVSQLEELYPQMYELQDSIQDITEQATNSHLDNTSTNFSVIQSEKINEWTILAQEEQKYMEVPVKYLDQDEEYLEAQRLARQRYSVEGRLLDQRSQQRLLQERQERGDCGILYPGVSI